MEIITGFSLLGALNKLRSLAVDQEIHSYIYIYIVRSFLVKRSVCIYILIGVMILNLYINI